MQGEEFLESFYDISLALMQCMKLITDINEKTKDALKKNEGDEFAKLILETVEHWRESEIKRTQSVDQV